MERGKLEFLKTMTLEKFKSEQMAQKLQVLENKEKGTMFFTCGGVTGAVSNKGVPRKEPMISLVRGDEDEEFYLFHEQGSGGASVIATF